MEKEADGLWKDSGLNDRQLRSVLKAPGRETAAGRALFALYNGFHLARQRGNIYSLRNKPSTDHQLHNLLSGNVPPQPSDRSKLPASQTKPQKPIVKVPRFRRRCSSEERAPKIDELRGRKRATEILHRLREDFSKLEPPPPPTKPPIDDKEKQRVQKLFEWSGRIDKEQILNPPKPRRSLTIGKGNDEKEVLLDSISKEIDEREAFLRDMESLGRGHHYREQITKEIEERIKQMKILDGLISQEDNKKFQQHK